MSYGFVDVEAAKVERLVHAEGDQSSEKGKGDACCGLETRRLATSGPCRKPIDVANQRDAFEVGFLR